MLFSCFLNLSRIPSINSLTAVGVAVPFAVAVQMGITFLFSVMSGVMSRCDRMAENADTRGIERVNYLALLALGTFYFLCAFLPIYFGAECQQSVLPCC